MNRPARSLGLLVALVAVPAFATPLDKLQDAFGGSAVDASLWTQIQVHGTVSESGGTLNLTPNANTGAAGLQLESASTYAFTGSQAAVHAVRMPSSAGNVDAQFSVLLDGSNYVQWLLCAPVDEQLRKGRIS